MQLSELNEECLKQLVNTKSLLAARIRTIAPADFVRFKRWLSELPDRDPLKRRRDRLQADLVNELLANYLPQLQ